MGRKKENRITLSVSVDEHTPELLKAQALKLGYIYNKEGATGKYLDAIATGKVNDLGDVIAIVFKKI